MPSFKKLIVSGSDATLSNLNVTGKVQATSLTGSLQATHVQGTLHSNNIPGLDASKLTTGTIHSDRMPANFTAPTASIANSVAWANISGKPSTFSPSSHSHTFASLTSKPTTLAGYGITDAFDGTYSSLTGKPNTFTPSPHNQAWSTITNTPTTLAGYGITDSFDGTWNSLSGKPSTFTPSAHNHDSDYLQLTGGTMSGLITFQTADTNNGFYWNVNSDQAGINFKNTGDGDNNSYLNFFTKDNGNEYIKFSHRHYLSGGKDWLDVKDGTARFNGNIYVNADQNGSWDDGTNYLSGGDLVWHSGNLSNVSTLTNDANYISTTSVQALHATNAIELVGNLLRLHRGSGQYEDLNLSPINTDTDTVTSVGTSGNESTGTITIQGGGSTIVGQTGNVITIASTDTNTTYNTATASALGLVKIGYAENGKNYPVELNSSGQMYVNVPWVNTDTNTTYSRATSSTDGLVRIGFPESGKNYPIELNASGQMFVNVPWVDTNTETTTTLTEDSANQRLVYTDEDGTVNYVDLSWAVDDTNLARIANGTLNGSTGIATFTRDDNTSFTVDFSALLDDTNTNYYVNAASFNTSNGVLTLSRNDGNSVTVDLDGRYALAHSHPYLPLAGGTLTGDLTLNSATPQIVFNGTSDAGADMAIKATPEGLDFYEPEDNNKVHFQILDDNGVNAAFGLQVGGTSVITSNRVLGNVTGNISMFTNDAGYLTSYTDTTYSQATSSALGLVKIGYTENGKNYPVELNGSGQMYVNVPWVNTDTNTTYSTATSSALGLVKIGYTENGRNYPVELNASGQMFVNVPWVDTNTNTNNYLSSLSFNTSNGVLTAGRQGLSDLTVDLDGRYLTSLPSHNHDTRYIRKDAADTFTRISNTTYNDTPGFLKGVISLRPGTAGGRTGIGFSTTQNVNTETGQDYGYLWWYDDNNNYAFGDGSEENAALILGIQNDSSTTDFGGTQDAVVLESSANIFLNPGLANHQYGGVAGPDFTNGKVYIGRAAESYEVWHAGNLTNVSQLTNDAGYISSYVNTVTSVGTAGNEATGTITIQGGGSTIVGQSGNTITISSADTTYATATSSTAGLVKIGYGENGKNYPVELNASGQMYVNVPWVDTNTTYGTASSTTAGLVKIGYTENGKNYPVELSNGQMYVNVPWVDTNTTYGVATTSANGLMSSSDKQKLNNIAPNANNYSLPAGSSSTRGGFKIGYAENGRNYPVEVSSEKMYVNVPWTDTNTVYTHPTYTARSINTSGAQVLDTFTSDASGHVTGITTRNLTPGDIGAATSGHTHTVLGSVNFSNGNLTNINNISIGDPGVGEGITWNGGNGFSIYESPNDLTTNTAGNLQFVKSGTRVLTLDTNGDGEFTGNLTVGGNLTVTGTTITNNVEMVSTSNGVIFEGSTADANETTLVAANPTADNTITLPNSSGTVALTSQLPTVNNGTLTVQGTGALGGSGTFTANQSGNTTISISHDDTSALSGTYGGNNNGVVIEDITVDAYGHVTAIGTRDLDSRYQAAGTYNTVIGTDTDINTSGATIIDSLTLTDGVITGHGTRNLTLADLGYTGETDTLATVTARGNATTSGITVNGNILLAGTATTTDQGRMIDFTGFDKEGTTDLSDRAYIKHTVNTGGHGGSVLVISSQNDSNDGIAFLTNGSSKLKHNSQNIATEDWVTSQNYQPAGTYNTVIGTDTDVDTSGATIIDRLYMTDGVITSHGTRDLTLADLGYTGATNANYITNNSQIANGRGYTTYSANQAVNTTSAPQFARLGVGQAADSTVPLTVYASGSTVFDVQGSVGQLFSVTDSLTGDIFAVSDISGIPILNVNSNGEVTVDDTLIVSGSITTTSDGDSSTWYSAITGATASNDTITFTRGNGSTFQVSTSDANTNNYTTGLSFDTSNGVLTMTRSGLGNLTVDLDGRFTDNGYADTMNQHVRTTDTPTFNEATLSGGRLNLGKNGTDSTIAFAAQTNDPGYIRHYESNNTARMYFSVSDDSGTTDYFGFGYSGAQDRFIIYSNGSFLAKGDGRVTGTFRADGDIIAYYSSDERLKENIKPIENASNKIKKIGGYTYDWNDKQDTYEPGTHDMGVIAQEVEEVAPELVTTRDNGFKAVKYEKLVALLIESNKELLERVEALEEQLKNK